MSDVEGTGANPFAEVERQLERPPATGVFVVRVGDQVPLATAGLQTGDVVVRVGENEIPDLGTFYRAMQPQGEDDGDRVLHVVREGAEHVIEAPPGIQGVAFCFVRADEAAWRQVTDADEDVELSGLEDGTEIWLRSCFGEEPAGFEWLRVGRDGDALSVEHVMRLGGEHEGRTWDYCTRGLTTHRPERGRPITRTAFFQGLGDKEARVGDVAVAAGGVDRITGYSVMLLPLTMPLREGASLTFVGAGDGTAVPSGRGRIECLGRRETEVAGETVPAWCFAWRHYGARPPENDEHFHVSDDRRLLRVDWGPDYNGCWSEAMTKDAILATIPEHLRGAL